MFISVFVFRWFPAVGPESDEGGLGRETGSKPEVPRKFFSAGRAGGFQKVPQKPNRITNKNKKNSKNKRPRTQVDAGDFQIIRFSCPPNREKCKNPEVKA